MRRFWAGAVWVLVCAMPTLSSVAREAAAESPGVAAARKLVKSDAPAERRKGFDALAAENGVDALQVTLEALRQSLRDAGKFEKTLDALEDAVWIAEYEWDFLRFSLDPRQIDRARRALEDAQRARNEQSSRLEGLFHVTVAGGNGLERFTDEAACSLIETGAKGENDPWLRQWMIRATARQKRPSALPTVFGLLTASDPRIRALAASELVAFGARRSVHDRLVPLVGDKAWPVRDAAYRGIARAPADFAAPLLVEAAQRETGEIALRLDGLLASLVGVSFRESPALWGAWWKEHGAAVIGGSYDAPERKPQEPVQTRETFFGIPVVSSNVMFVLDSSGSMEEPFEHADVRNREIRTKHKLPATRYGVAQAETIRAIQSLPTTARFSIIAFASKTERFSDVPVVASDSTKVRAIAWLLGRKARYTTNVYEALRAAFGDPTAPGSGSRLPDLPDTIVFLSDGVPSDGRVRGEETLAELAGLWNAGVGARIDGVGIGTEPAAGMLTMLAEGTGGTYADLRDLRSAVAGKREGIPPAQRVGAIARVLASADSLSTDKDDVRRVAAIRTLAPIAAWSAEALRRIVAGVLEGSAPVRDVAVEVLSNVDPAAGPAIVSLVRAPLDAAAVGTSPTAVPVLLVLERLGPAAASATPSLLAIAQASTSPYRLEAVRAIGAQGPAAKSVLVSLSALRATAPAPLAQAIDAAVKSLRR